MTVNIFIIVIGLIIVLIIRLIPVYRNHPWLFKKQIQHDKFGRMWFVSFKENPSINHYQAHILFNPINKEIDLYFDSESGIFDQNQALFFNKIEDRYQDLSTLCSKHLEKILSISIDDFNNEFTLFAILICKISNINQLWELNYLSDTHKIPNIKISFNNWEIDEKKSFTNKAEL